MKKILFFAAALLGTLIVLDLFLQFAGIQTPMETRIDPRIGPVYIPNKLITHFNEGFFIGAVNEYGYMGPAVPPRRRNTERRILLLGDSYVLAHTVLPRHYFARYLEEQLAQATGNPVQTLNFGKADFNLRNMYQYYTDFAGTFDHDLTLFFVGKGDLIPSVQVISSLYPSVELRNNTLTIDRSFRYTRTYRFYKTIEPVFTHSAVLRLVFNAFKMVDSGRLGVVVLDKFAPHPHDSQKGNEPNTPERPAKMSPVNLAILREIAKDPRNILVIREDLDPDLMAEIRAIGMPMINLFSRLDLLQAEGKDPYYWPITAMRGHWNHYAHKIIGGYLADHLLSMGMIWPHS
jgi:hypothetical protein